MTSKNALPQGPLEQQRNQAEAVKPASSHGEMMAQTKIDVFDDALIE
jgi:hypothetical protein